MIVKVTLISDGFLIESITPPLKITITQEKSEWITRIFNGKNLIIAPIPSITSPWISNDWRDKKIIGAIKTLGLNEESAQQLLKEITIEVDIYKTVWFSSKKSTKEFKNAMAIKKQKELQEIDKYRKRALDILQNSNPLEYLMDAVSKRHKGDASLVASLHLSFSSMLVKGYADRYIIGPSGKGKSNACNEVGKTFPAGTYESLIGSSAKSKIYAILDNSDALKGKIFYYDDTRNDDLEFRRLLRVIKDLRPDEERWYETVIEGKYTQIRLTGSCCVWESSVELPFDSQDSSRAFVCKVEESDAHDREIEMKSKEL